MNNRCSEKCMTIRTMPVDMPMFKVFAPFRLSCLLVYIVRLMMQRSQSAASTFGSLVCAGTCIIVNRIKLSPICSLSALTSTTLYRQLLYTTFAVGFPLYGKKWSTTETTDSSKQTAIDIQYKARFIGIFWGNN